MEFQSYAVLKALHLISIICWMAGMLYLPRIFVYHANSKKGESSDTFKIMERRLLKFIMTPAMVLSYVFGIWIVTLSAEYYMSSGWFHTKLLLVLILSGVHGYFAVCVKNFAFDQNKHSAKFYRFINEVPTVLMIAIVFLVVLKAF